MSFPKPPPPAMFLWAVISRYGEAADWVRRRIEGTTLDAAGAEAAWGPVVLTSPPFAFDQTEYYRKSMGEGLTKVFLACGARTDPARLAEAKRQSNRWEEEFAAESAWEVGRPVNIDPGYLMEDKFVLASTKNHAHRIYLRDGIYAELTLQYRRGRWVPLETTYPDYRQPEYHEFFTLCRNFLRDHVK